MTTITYTIPATPQAPNTSPALDKACHGALNTAEMNKTAQKCTTVGVPKARTSSMLAAASASEISAITANCKPVNAPAEEPTITYKLYHGASGSAMSIQI